MTSLSGAWLRVTAHVTAAVCCAAVAGCGGGSQTGPGPVPAVSSSSSSAVTPAATPTPAAHTPTPTPADTGGTAPVPGAYCATADHDKIRPAANGHLYQCTYYPSSGTWRWKRHG